MPRRIKENEDMKTNKKRKYWIMLCAVAALAFAVAPWVWSSNSNQQEHSCGTAGGTCASEHKAESHTEEEHEEDAHEEDAHSEEDHEEDIHTEDDHAEGEDEHEDTCDGHEETHSSSDPVLGEIHIELDEVASAEFDLRRRFPARVKTNADRNVRIVATAGGIVREVDKHLGDSVKQGEVLAWVESRELGEAKIDFLGKWSELNCCSMELTRAEAVCTNVLNFLKTLRANPSLEELRELDGSPMGEHRGTLVSAYAEYIYAQEAYKREKVLYEKEITSREEFLQAENAYKKADAVYASVMDDSSFQVQHELMECQQAQRIQQVELVGEEQSLYLLGLSPREVKELTEADFSALGFDSGCTDCGNPNCPHVKAAKAGNPGEDPSSKTPLGWYPLRAPFDGTIVDKTVGLGDFLTPDSQTFTVADLSSVWVDIQIYEKELAAVRIGRPVRISSRVGEFEREGTIQYISPLLDERTGTALSRVVVPNADGMLKPGQFVEAEVSVDHIEVAASVSSESVQNLNGEDIVFCQTDYGLEPVEVALGRRDNGRVEILEGLKPGQKYVAEGAFELKAKLVTENLDPHAGHGH